MKPDEPHVFEPMPDTPMVLPKTGPMMPTGAGPSGGVVGNMTSRLCQICRRPEKNRLHIPVPDASEPEHWG